MKFDEPFLKDLWCTEGRRKNLLAGRLLKIESVLNRMPDVATNGDSTMSFEQRGRKVSKGLGQTLAQLVSINHVPREDRHAMFELSRLMGYGKNRLTSHGEGRSNLRMRMNDALNIRAGLEYGSVDRNLPGSGPRPLKAVAIVVEDHDPVGVGWRW
jgi:hypothetical protein